MLYTPLFQFILWSPPGAMISTLCPKFEYQANAPLGSLAATVITLSQLAGVTCETSSASFPAAATTTAPAETASFTASCITNCSPAHGTRTAKLRLITLAGVALGGSWSVVHRAGT